MTTTPQAIGLIAANPGPAAHMALLGIIVVIIGLIVFAVVRVRRKREAAEAENLGELERRDRHTAAGKHRDRAG